MTFCFHMGGEKFLLKGKSKDLNRVKRSKCSQMAVHLHVRYSIYIFTSVNTAHAKDKLSCTESLVHQLTPKNCAVQRGCQDLLRESLLIHLSLVPRHCLHELFQACYLLNNTWWEKITNKSRDFKDHLIRVFIKFIIFLSIFPSL